MLPAGRGEVVMTGINIGAYPKIFAVGHRNVINIFEGEVEVTEKVDGSAFAFGKDMEGKLHMRSKGALIDIDNPPQMFQIAVDYVLSIQDRIPNDVAYYCEYLNKPKHNSLTYDRVPTNNLTLYGYSDFCRTKMQPDHCDLVRASDFLGIDTVPLIYHGYVSNKEDVFAMLDRKSYLGGERDIEGVVIKNYAQNIELNGQLYPVVTAKYVSEAFKEVHSKTWKADHTTRGGWDLFVKNYCTEARWEKAVQHLREQDLLTNSPKDIGALMKEINQDITNEEKDAIKDFLWKTFSKDLFRTATRGFPQWYKDKLVADSFDSEDVQPRTLAGDV